MSVSNQPSSVLTKRDRSPSLDKLFTPGRPDRPLNKGRSNFIEVFRSLEADYSMVGNNKVWLSEHTFEKLFYNIDVASKCYVKIAHFIFEVGINNDLSEGEINVDEVQVEHLEKYCTYLDDGAVLKIRSYHEREYDHKELDHITFTLKEYSKINKNGEGKKKPTIDVGNLRKFVHEKINGQFLEQGQSLLLNHPLGMLTATVDCHKYTKDPFDGLVLKDNIKHGRIVENTKIDFICDSDEFKIVKPQNPQLIERFHFTITGVIDISRRELGIDSSTYSKENAWKNENLPLPLAVPLDNVSELLRKNSKNVSLAFGNSVKIRVSQGWQLKLKFTKVTLKDFDDPGEPAVDRYENKYTKIFKLQNQHLVNLSPGEDCIFTTEMNDALPATRVTFTIVDMLVGKKTHKHQHHWVSYKELIDGLNKDYFAIPESGKFVVKTTSGKFLLKLITAIGSQSKSKKSINKKISDIWSIDEATDIRIKIGEGLNLEMVDNRVEKFAKSMTFKVELQKKNNMIFKLLGNKDRHEEIMLEEAELKELLLDNLPPTIFPKHEISTATEQGPGVIFTLTEYNYTQKGETLPKYGLRLKPERDTIIKFDVKKDSGLIIATKPEKIEPINLPEKLIELGIGGLTKECTLFLRDIMLSRGEYREYYKSLGINAVRGAILYGPPGTGKTKLARNFADLLGVTGERQILLTGSKVKSKWVGESEKNIRKLFKTARIAQQEYGDKSPLYVLIIDEIDAILGTRNNGSSSHDTSLVTTFLSELDGIAGDDGKSLNNILVIGLTNDLNIIDEAVKRPGRLGKHISIGIPDFEGRKEIIGIHTRRLISHNLIEGDISEMIDWFAHKTNGKTGAFIEGVVQNVLAVATGRLAELNVRGEEALNHRASKITRKDIEDAIKALETGKGEVPLGMYS